MLERAQLVLAVGHADVAAGMAFHSSMDYSHTGNLDRQWWKDVRSLRQIKEPLTLTERAFAVVEGDVLADVALSAGGTLVIYGDVRASIRTSGQCEVVVAGSVMEAADVSGGGILHL